MEECSRGKILICDDMAPIRMTLSNILKRENFKVFEAINGEQAITDYQSINPDIVVMDLIMPKMDGIEALEKIKEIDCNAKIIMCSSLCEPYTMNEAFSKGALDFIIKPFSDKRVVEAVTRALD